MLNKVLTIILNWLGGKIILALKQWYEDQKQKKINEENLAKYRKAVETGNVEEIKKRGADLLNGVSDS